MMDEFSYSELLQILATIDAELTETTTVIVVGGAFAMLAGAPVMSDDVDVVADPEFWKACEAARAKGARVPVNHASLMQPPYDYEDRLSIQTLPQLSKLRLAVPEVHDWAIMKLARGDAHDIEHISGVHRHRPLSMNTLLERFRSTDSIGSRRMFELALLDCVEQLFGEAAREQAERELAG